MKGKIEKGINRQRWMDGMKRYIGFSLASSCVKAKDRIIYDVPFSQPFLMEWHKMMICFKGDVVMTLLRYNRNDVVKKCI